MHKNISSEVKKILLKNQTCDLLSIQKQTCLPAVSKTHGIYIVIANIAVSLKFRVIFLDFLLIDEQRNVLYANLRRNTHAYCSSRVHFQLITPRDNCI